MRQRGLGSERPALPGGGTRPPRPPRPARSGLRTALVEKEDFAAGTSSRSTKLVHGGVRYLEKAVKSLDFGQFKLVFEALHERGRLLRNVPYLAHELPIMTVRGRRRQAGGGRGGSAWLAGCWRQQGESAWLAGWLAGWLAAGVGSRLREEFWS